MVEDSPHGFARAFGCRACYLGNLRVHGQGQEECCLQSIGTYFVCVGLVFV